MKSTTLLATLFFAVLLLFPTCQIFSVDANDAINSRENASPSLSHCPPQPIITRPASKGAKKYLSVKLIRAVRAGDLAEFKALATKENILLRDRKNDTIAHLVARVGNVEMLRFIVSKEKALIEAKGEFGNTPLITATISAHGSVVRFLLENGAAPNSLAKNGYGNVMNNYALHIAAEHGYSDVVKMLMQYGANINGKNGDDAIPLHLAVKTASLEVVKYLVEGGSGSNNTSASHSAGLAFVKDRNGNLAIHIAATRRRTDIVRYLARVDPNQLAVHGNLNRTVLHIAAIKNDGATIREILNYRPNLEALANYRDDPNGTQPSATALMLASAAGNERIVRLLLQGGANNTAVDWRGSAAVHLASSRGHCAVIEVLCDKNPKHVNLAGGSNYTPLHFAVLNLQYKVVHLLLDRGADISARATHLADPITATPSVTPLLLSTIVGNLQIFRALVESGARVDQPDFQDGQFPIHLAAQNGHIAVVEDLLEKDVCQLEWRGGIYEETPLSIAIRANMTEMAFYLIGKGANVEANSGHSSGPAGNDTISIPLILATRKKNYVLVETLLHNGANPHAVDEHGSTALHYAAMLETTQITELLLHYGASSGEENIYRDTPTELALGNVRSIDQFALLVANDPLPLHHAVEKENMALARRAVHYLPRRLNQLSQRGETALAMAVRLEKVNMVVFLIEAGLRVDTTNADGNTLLHMAACVSNPIKRWRLVEMILHELGTEAEPLLQLRNDTAIESIIGIAARDEVLANILRRAAGKFLSSLSSAANDSAVHGRRDSAIHMAAKRGRTAVVKALLDKHPLSVNLKGNSYYTPLHYAVVNQHYEAVRLLLMRGANLSARATYWVLTNMAIPSATPLLFAAIVGNLRIFRALVESGARVDLPDSQYGWSPILLAAHNGRIAIVEELLAMDPCQLEWRKFKNHTPMHHVISSKQSEMAEYFIPDGANIETKSHYFSDTSTFTPLIHATLNANEALVKSLLHLGADPNAGDKFGNTALHISLSLYYQPTIPLYLTAPSLIDLLVSYGAAIELENGLGYTSTEMAFDINPNGDVFRLLAANDPQPLHRAVIKNDIALIRKAVHLIPSRLNLRNRQEETALEMAVRLGKVDVAGAMIGAGLRIDTVNADGNTLLHIAANHLKTTTRAQLVKMIVQDASADLLPTLLSRSNKSEVSVIDIAKRDPIVAKLLRTTLPRKTL